MALDKEDYIKVRQAMQQGARTISDIEKMTDISIVDEEHKSEIQEVLDNACRCKNVSYDTVAKAVKGGADTLEKVQEETGAGTGCGRCKQLLERIIEDNK